MAATRHDEHTTGSPVPGWLGWAVGIAGVAALLYSNRNPEPEWLRYAGFGFVVLGIILYIFSGLTKEQIIDWTKNGVVALLIALTFRWAIAEPYRIPSDSMFPTLDGDNRIGLGDRVFVNKWVYGLRVPFMNKRIWYGQQPERWDVVVFKAVEEDAAHGTLVKRIVGLPGERILIRDGRVYVADADAPPEEQGQPLGIPPYMPEDQWYSSGGGGFDAMKYGIWEVPEFTQIPQGHYLLLGDNTQNSKDGRYFGWVPNNHIVGRVSAIVWPPARWRDFTGFTQSWWWKTLLVLLALWLFWRLFIGRSWAVVLDQGRRMAHLYVSFLSYGLRLPFTRRWLVQWQAPRQGDLVLYHPASTHEPVEEPLVGRIAGLPGQTVELHEGKLHVDREPVASPHVLAYGLWRFDNGQAQYGRPRSKGYTEVPEKHYYILADPAHDGVALDSRRLGWVPRHRVMGKVKAVWWPPKRVRRVH